MNFLAFSGLINFIASISMGTFVLLKNPRSAQHRSYFYFNSCVAFYSFGYWIWQMSATAENALAWLKILTVGIIFIGPAYIHFIFAFLGLQETRRREIFLHYAAGIPFTYCVIASLFFAEVVPRYNMGFWPVTLPLGHFYIGFWFCQIFYGFSWILRGLKMTKGIKREQIWYFTFATLLGFGGGATNWLLWYNIKIFPVTIAISLYVSIMTYALVRLRFLNIASLTAQGIFILCYAIILVIPFLLGYTIKNWFMATAIAVVAGAAGPPVYRWLVAKTTGRLLSEQRQYQQMLKNTAQQMLRYHDTHRLVSHIVKTCVNVVRLNGAYIFLLNRNTKNFDLAAGESTSAAPAISEIGQNDPVIEALRKNAGFMNLEALNMEYGDAALYGERSRIRRFSEDLGASLVFAIRADGNMLGLLALGQKLNGAIYTREDTEAFSLLSAQSALALENCQYLDEIKGLYEKAVTDKLTGCYNRMFYEEYLEKSVADAHRSGSMLHLAMLDLNSFKHLNDTYGHDAGDNALRVLGNVLRKSFRKSDVVVRYGGDEFTVFIQGATRAECESAFKQFLDNLNNSTMTVRSGNEEIPAKISVSIGIAALGRGQTPHQLVQAADAALFEAKRSGRSYSFSK